MGEIILRTTSAHMLLRLERVSTTWRDIGRSRQVALQRWQLLGIRRFPRLLKVAGVLRGRLNTNSPACILGADVGHHIYRRLYRDQHDLEVGFSQQRIGTAASSGGLHESSAFTQLDYDEEVRKLRRGEETAEKIAAAQLKEKYVFTFELCQWIPPPPPLPEATEPVVSPPVPARVLCSWSRPIAYQTEDGPPGLMLPELWDEARIIAIAADVLNKKRSPQDRIILTLKAVTSYFSTVRDPGEPGFERMTALRVSFYNNLRLRVLVSKVSSEGLHTLCLGDDLRCTAAAADGSPEWFFESVALPGCAENSLRLGDVCLNMDHLLGPIFDRLFTGGADRAIQDGAGSQPGVDEYDSPCEAVQVAEYLERMAPWRVVT